MNPGMAMLKLEIELDSDPIRGSVALSGGAACAFSGWIELAGAIEAARSSSPTRRDDGPLWALRRGWRRPAARAGSVPSDGDRGADADGDRAAEANGDRAAVAHGDRTAEANGDQGAEGVQGAHAGGGGARDG